MALLDGVKVNLSGRDLVVPPLNLRGLKKLKDQIKSLQLIEGVPGEAQVEALIDIIFTALTRNYPNLTRDEVEDIVDLSNLPTLVNAVLAQSGLVQKGGAQPGEAVSPTATPGPTTTGTT